MDLNNMWWPLAKMTERVALLYTYICGHVDCFLLNKWNPASQMHAGHVKKYGNEIANIFISNDISCFICDVKDDYWHL